MLEEGGDVAVDVLKTMADFASHVTQIDPAKAQECLEVVYSESLVCMVLLQVIAQ